MSNTNDSRQDTSSSNRIVRGTKEQYRPGMILEGSMFPPGRDEKVWGPQHPLDVARPLPPPDDDTDSESWRLSCNRRYIYTGDTHVRRPVFDTPKGLNKLGSTGHATQPCQRQEAPTILRFPDALPAPWISLSVMAPHTNNTTRDRQPVMQAPGSVQTAPPNSRTDVSHTEAGSQPQNQQFLEKTLVPRPHQYPDVNNAQESVNSNLARALHHPAIPTDTPREKQPPTSDPPETSTPRGIDDWDDDSLLTLWKLKAIRKKGYEPMLPHFPGHTADSLAETWKAHKRRCAELGTAWRAAGKPDGGVAEWLVE